MRKTLSQIVGAGLIACGVLTFLNEFIFPGFFRALWTIMFGILIIFHQLKWKSMINKYFGFLNMWYARGAFFIFVGTNGMTLGSGSNDSNTFSDLFSIVAGGACVFVGLIELAFGFKCSKEAGEADDANPKAGTNAVEPTLSVNVTPNQIAQGANWAAQNPGTVAAVANAGASVAAANSGGGGANPFFGNQHLGGRT